MLPLLSTPFCGERGSLAERTCLLWKKGRGTTARVEHRTPGSGHWPSRLAACGLRGARCFPAWLDAGASSSVQLKSKKRPRPGLRLVVPRALRATGRVGEHLAAATITSPKPPQPRALASPVLQPAGHLLVLPEVVCSAACASSRHLGRFTTQGDSKLGYCCIAACNSLTVSTLTHAPKSVVVCAVVK